MPIHVLPPEIATRIAAGEVVERPASVVKELVENAIDAGAGEVRLEIQGGGRKRMRVLDDGSGIPADEVELAFARHSTSKLNSVDDLEHIRTLGFRGEALASIASVARVTLNTRARGERVGTLLRLEGGRIVAREPSGHPPGTDVVVQDLFFNVPARRKFLRTERTERRHIDVLVTRYAMAYPDLRFILLHGGRTTFRSNGSGDLQEVLVSVYGADGAGQMLRVGSDDDDEAAPSEIRVNGYVSAPSLHRSNRNEITLFVNGRWVQDRRLTYAVTQAYHTLLMTGRHPIAVIKVAMPPTEVDVNVHPAKTEVRFRDGDAVFRAVQRAVRRALVDQASVPEFRAGAPSEGDVAGDRQAVGSGESGWPGGWPTPEQMLRRAQLRAIGTGSSRRPDRPVDPEALQFALELGRPAADSGTGDEPEADDAVAGQGSRRPRQLPFLRVVGQLGLTYVVAEGPEGMFLVDQHAAHERVLYEKFMAAKARAQIATQTLLEPLVVELTAEGADLVEESLEALLALGFDVEPFGSNAALVRAVPATLADVDVQALFNEIVADLQVGDKPLAEEIEARVVRRVCKRAAIKAGQTLSKPEMEELIRQLEACAAPHTCPHGRPTMIHMSAERLAKEFGRLG